MVWETTFLFSAWRKLKKSSNWHFVSAASYNLLCKLQLKIFVSQKAIKSSWPQDFVQPASNKLSWPKWRHTPVFWRNILHFNALSSGCMYFLTQNQRDEIISYLNPSSAVSRHIHDQILERKVHTVKPWATPTVL